MTRRSRASGLRKKAATGGMFVSQATLRDLISDEVRDVFADILTPLWTEAWHLGYQSAKSLVTGQPADFTAKDGMEHLPGSSAPRGSTGYPRCPARAWGTMRPVPSSSPAPR